jgi:hypothetical protein
VTDPLAAREAVARAYEAINVPNTPIPPGIESCIRTQVSIPT